MFRLLPSTISTQDLERIVNSKESLTSNIETSKSLSDISASSKTNFDIDYPKINDADIDINTQSTRQLVYKVKSEIMTCESNRDIQQNFIVEANVEAHSLKSNLVDSEPIKAEIIAPVEIMKVEQTKVAAKRGKLTHTASNLNALFYHFKILKNPQIGESTNIEKIRIIIFEKF